METSQLLLIVLQLSPILAQLNFHCITNEDEFTVGGWSSSVPIEFAKTERDLPLVFQGQMSAADGIFYLVGDGVDSFMTIDSPFSLNLLPPVNLYVRYYAHVPVIADPSQGVVVYPDPDSSTKDLKLASDFIWQNETIKIDENVANADEIAIWFQNAQVGDFLLIDSLIITEGAALSDEEMVALCSPSTSPVPTSTSTADLSSSSSSVSLTSTTVTGSSSTSSTTESSSTSPMTQSTPSSTVSSSTTEISSTSSTTESSSTSPVSQSTPSSTVSSSTTESSSTSSMTESSSASPASQTIPSSTSLSSITDSYTTIRSSETWTTSTGPSSPTITQSTNAPSTSPQSSSSTGSEQSSSSAPDPSTTDSKSSSSVSLASTTDGPLTSELSSSSQSSDRSTLTTSENSISSKTSMFYTSGAPNSDQPATTIPTVVSPPGSSGGLKDYELVLAVGLPFLFLLLLLIMVYYILTRRRRRRRSVVSESALQLYNDASSPSAKPSITMSNIDSADDNFQITNNNTDLKGLYLTRLSTDAHSRSPSLYRSSIDPLDQSYAADPTRLSLPSGDLLGADLIRRGSNISNLSRASARSTYSGIQEQGWALPRLIRDN